MPHRTFLALGGVVCLFLGGLSLNEVHQVVAWMRSYMNGLGFAPVARSWLYAFESERIICKGDFEWAGKWLADRRKEGLIPFHLVGRDTTRGSLDGIPTTRKQRPANTSTARSRTP